MTCYGDHEDCYKNVLVLGRKRIEKVGNHCIGLSKNVALLMYKKPA